MQPVMLVLLCEVIDLPKKPAWRCGNRSLISLLNPLPGTIQASHGVG